MTTLKEKQAVVCGPLGEIQATPCGVGRDQCDEAAVGHLLPHDSCWSLAVAIWLPAPVVAALGCDFPQQPT